MSKVELKPCPRCKVAIIHHSPYENEGYVPVCRCGRIQSKVGWQPTREKAIEAWNKIAESGGETNA